MPPLNVYASSNSAHVWCCTMHPKPNSNTRVSSNQKRPINNQRQEANGPYHGAATNATRKTQMERMAPLATSPEKLPKAGTSALSLSAPLRMASTRRMSQSAADFSQTRKFEGSLDLFTAYICLKLEAALLCPQLERSCRCSSDRFAAYSRDIVAHCSSAKGGHVFAPTLCRCRVGR